MNPKIQMTGRLIAAGRTLAGISQEDFASFVGLPVESLCQMEAKGSAWIDSQENAERISQGLDQIGIVVRRRDRWLGRGGPAQIYPPGCKASGAIGERRRQRRL